MGQQRAMRRRDRQQRASGGACATAPVRRSARWTARQTARATTAEHASAGQGWPGGRRAHHRAGLSAEVGAWRDALAGGGQDDAGSGGPTATRRRRRTSTPAMPRCTRTSSSRRGLSRFSRTPCTPLPAQGHRRRARDAHAASSRRSNTLERDALSGAFAHAFFPRSGERLLAARRRAT
jgi:hypothetical protein